MRLLHAYFLAKLAWRGEAPRDTQMALAADEVPWGVSEKQAVAHEIVSLDELVDLATAGIAVIAECQQQALET